jgi:hypothetical protein
MAVGAWKKSDTATASDDVKKTGSELPVFLLPHRFSNWRHDRSAFNKIDCI